MINYDKQEGLVLEYFDAVENATPSATWRYISDILGNVPLTSIRRAITNLTSKDQLRKTEWKRVGIYGRLEHVWEKCCEDRDV